jgi:hypothetical protein
MLTRSEIFTPSAQPPANSSVRPTRAECMRLSDIHYGRLIPHFPVGYREAIRAGGISRQAKGILRRIGQGFDEIGRQFEADLLG